MQQVLDLKSKQVTGARRSVLLVMAWHARDEAKECWAGSDRIAVELGINRGTVRRAILWLEGAGMVQRSGKKNRAIRYELTPNNWMNDAPCTMTQSVEEVHSAHSLGAQRTPLGAQCTSLGAQRTKIQVHGAPLTVSIGHQGHIVTDTGSAPACVPGGTAGATGPKRKWAGDHGMDQTYDEEFVFSRFCEMHEGEALPYTEICEVIADAMKRHSATDLIRAIEGNSNDPGCQEAGDHGILAVMGSVAAVHANLAAYYRQQQAADTTEGARGSQQAHGATIGEESTPGQGQASEAPQGEAWEQAAKLRDQQIAADELEDRRIASSNRKSRLFESEDS